VDEVEDRRTYPAATDNPLEMHQEEAKRMTGWLLHLRRRFLYHHRSLELGADPLDVDIACIGELALFAGRDRVLSQLRLPSGELMRALSNKRDGGSDDYLDGRRKRGRPTLASRQHLLGTVAHFVEVLFICGAFGIGESAVEIASRLTAAGLREPDGRVFTDNTVTDWYERVKHSANHLMQPALE
jgi:hypothetical protein